jgi:hypothetical protein
MIHNAQKSMGREGQCRRFLHCPFHRFRLSTVLWFVRQHEDGHSVIENGSIGNNQEES